MTWLAGSPEPTKGAGAVDTFKDILHQDIKQTFLNPEEFGEEHTVNGKPMVIVTDDLEIIEREKKMRPNMDDGTFTRQVFFYVAAEDFGSLPAQGGIIDIDGMKYIVVDATDEAGVYGITVQANRSGGRTGGRR